MTHEAMSVNEVVKAVGIGRTRIFAEIKSGRLVARKVGRRTVILKEDLDAWLRQLPRAGRSVLANRASQAKANVEQA